MTADHFRDATELVLCPLCGAGQGYTLSEGSTPRWWIVSCAACGEDLGECRSDQAHRYGAKLPVRWAGADDHWNYVGAHAQRLRDFLATIRDAGMTAEEAAAHAADALRGATTAQEDPAADVPDGCTPADVAVLRRANHAIAQECHDLSLDLRLARVIATTAMDVLRQIAGMTRRTREQRLAESCVVFLDALSGRQPQAASKNDE